MGWCLCANPLAKKEIQSQYPGSLFRQAPSPAKKMPHNICKIEFHNFSVWSNNLIFQKKALQKNEMIIIWISGIWWTAEWRTNAKKIITVKDAPYAVFVKLESQQSSSFSLNMTQETRTCNSVVLGKNAH